MALTRRLYDSDGQPVELGPQVASGGEGGIYSLPAMPAFVAKVYHQRSAQRAAKLSAMARDNAPDLLKVAAWPTATLHETRHGPVAGFVMPKVSGYEEVHKLYGPAHRRKTFPKADWSFLVHTAMNCAAAFDALHARSYVVGDVNQSNILVSPRALVCLIDCDSFQVRKNGQLFLCEVGVAQYTPPELQDGNFRQVIRTPNHDRFGLAVLIFHLLFMGRHPFAGRYLGSGEMLLERAIKEFRFAYASWASQVRMAPPPFTLGLNVLSPQLASLFDRAFRPGSEASNARPTAADWRSALASFEQGLIVCPTDSGHKLPRNLGKCPWCEIMRTGGPNFFIGIAVVEVDYTPDERMFYRLWAQVEAVPDLSLHYLRPVVPAGHVIEPTASADDFFSNQTIIRLVGSIAICGLILLAAATLLWRLVCFGFPLALVFGVWWLILVGQSPLGKLRRRKMHEWRAASHAIAEAEAQWHTILSRAQGQFRQLRASLADVWHRARNLKAEYEAERRQLEENKESILRDQFLQGKFIGDAVANKEITGIGTGRQVLLESNGIETAYDIDENELLDIRGFGPVLVGNLLAWKRRVASEFRFDTKKGVPEAELMALTRKYKQRQDLLRAQLERGVIDLQAISRGAIDQLRSVWHTIQGHVIDLAQADTDLDALRTRRWAG